MLICWKNIIELRHALAANNFEGIEEFAGALKGRDVD